MEQYFHITDISNPKAKAFLEYIKTLDFISVDDDKHNAIPEWQKEQLDNALEEHKSGTANYTDWNQVQKNIFAKYNLK